MRDLPFLGGGVVGVVLALVSVVVVVVEIGMGSSMRHRSLYCAPALCIFFVIRSTMWSTDSSLRALAVTRMGM